MGENADDIIDGACCALCGEYFEQENGFPAVCSGCYDSGCGYSLSTFNTI